MANFIVEHSGLKQESIQGCAKGMVPASLGLLALIGIPNLPLVTTPTIVVCNDNYMKLRSNAQGAT